MITKTKERYQDITGITPKNVSQLKMFNILKDLDKIEYFANIFRTYKLNENYVDDYRYYIQHQVSNTDWWDSISEFYYGTPYLWWVIAAINNVTNPFEELNEGDSIKILKEQHLYRVIRNCVNIGRM